MYRNPTFLLLLSLLLGACGGGGNSGGDAIPAAVTAPDDSQADDDNADTDDGATDPLDAALLPLIEAAGLRGDAAFNRTLPGVDEPLAQLGMQLFFSKSLGGQFDAACVSCHHPALGGGDALSLPVGTGAADADLMGPGRVHADTGLPNVPRNAPTVFNAGLWDTGLFWDSRVESFGKEPEANGTVSDIRTPDVDFGFADAEAGPNLPAAQARFPVTSADEMRGFAFEPEGDNNAVRAHLAGRLGGYGAGVGELADNEWLTEFQSAFGPGTAEQLITFENIALALAEYQRSMVFTDNPFAAYVRGDLTAINNAQKRGAIVFYTAADEGGGGCASCHSGDTFTDGAHHTLGFPQFGPGKGDGNADDFGRERETGLTEDRYRFRTPTLLNIAETAPYGHAGTYASLQQVMQHYNNPRGTVDDFFGDGGACTLPQFEALDNCATLYPQSEPNSVAALDKLTDERDRGTSLFPNLNLNLNNNERDDLVAFLRALTDPCVTDSACRNQWVPANGPGPDTQQLNARDAGGNLL